MSDNNFKINDEYYLLLKGKEEGYEEAYEKCIKKVEELFNNALLNKSTIKKVLDELKEYYKENRYKINPPSCKLNEMENKSHTNARAIGFVNMTQQIMEESGELTHAMSKYLRASHLSGQPTNTKRDEALSNLILALADMEICCEQLSFLMDIELDVKTKKNSIIDDFNEKLRG